MWWAAVLVAAALTGGLFDWCADQVVSQSWWIPDNEAVEEFVLDEEWSTTRQEFEAVVYSEGESSELTTVYGGVGAFLTPSRGSPTYEIVNFSFWENSPAGWAEYKDRWNIRDCITGEPVVVLGDSVLIVHFDNASQDTDFRENPVRGKTVLEARQICDQDGMLEWAIGVSGHGKFNVYVSEYKEGDFEYGIVSFGILQ